MGRRPELGERASEPVVTRFPDEVLTRIDAYMKTLGLSTRSKAVRALVVLGLAAHYEAERKRLTSKRKKRAR